MSETPRNKSRNRTMCVKTTPQTKLTYFMYAAQHETHVSKVLEQIADCLRDNIDKTLRDCLEKGQ